MMNGSNWGIFACQFFLLISLTKSEDFCAGEESTVIKAVGAMMGVNSFTFVQNSQNVGILREIKHSPESKYFSAVANSEELDEILSDETKQKEFFGKRMILVTKEKLNFTSALEKVLGSSVVWIVFLESLDELEGSYIPINANFFTVHCTSELVILNKVYHIKHGFRLSVENIKTWPKGSVEGLLKIHENDIDFKGATFNLLYLSKEDECKNRTIHVLSKMECFHQDIVKIIAEKLNFTINKILCPERQFPYNYPNGTLSEMFDVLRRKEADISSGSFIISKGRLTKYDFAWPVFTTKSMMYIKFENGRSSWRAYLRPISFGVWKAIICWIFLTGFLLQFFKKSRERNFKFGFSLVPEFVQFLLISLQVFCNQGVHDMSRWNSSRTVIVLTFLLCVSLYQAYSGFLISSLTVVTPYIPFTDIKGFFRDGTYKIMTLKRGFHNYFVMQLIKELGDAGFDSILDDLPATSRFGINKLCTLDKLTYVEFRENLAQYEIPCKIIELPHPMLYQSIGIGLPKNSPLRKILNHHISVLRGTGILHRMREYLLSYVKLKERETSKEVFVNVSLWHVMSIFFIIVIGAVLSVIIFLIEIYCHFLNNSKIVLKHSHKKKVFVKRKRHCFSKLFQIQQNGIRTNF